MDRRTKALVLSLATLALLVGTVSVKAQWSALSSGYAVTTDYHGVEEGAPLGATVHAKAGTTNFHIVSVEFRWLPPPESGEEPEVHLVTEHLEETDPDFGPILVFRDSYAPLIVGDWGVQAIFHNETGDKEGGPTGTFFKIRATSFFAVPEIPLGTLTVTLSMLAALTVFTLKRRRI